VTATYQSILKLGKEENSVFKQQFTHGKNHVQND